jgi:hypothetical protein
VREPAAGAPSSAGMMAFAGGGHWFAAEPRWFGAGPCSHYRCSAIAMVGYSGGRGLLRPGPFGEDRFSREENRLTARCARRARCRRLGRPGVTQVSSSASAWGDDCAAAQPSVGKKRPPGDDAPERPWTSPVGVVTCDRS